MICRECYANYMGQPGVVLCPLHEATAELLEACKAAMLLFDGHELRKDSAVIAQLPKLLQAAIQKAEGA